MSKAREFWIDPDSDDDDMSTFIAFRRHPRQGDLEWQESLVHVIERSYATKLEEENKRLRDALEFYKSYADCSYSCSSRRDSWILRCSCGFEKKDREMRKALSGETKEGV